MYLFVCETFDGSCDYRFIKALTQYDALMELYKQVAFKKVPVELFEKMVMCTEFWERVEIFNVLFPTYQIKALYGSLYKIDIEEESNVEC